MRIVDFRFHFALCTLLYALGPLPLKAFVLLKKIGNTEGNPGQNIIVPLVNIPSDYGRNIQASLKPFRNTIIIRNSYIRAYVWPVIIIIIKIT